MKTHAAHFIKFIEEEAEKHPTKIDLEAIQNDITNIQTIISEQNESKKDGRNPTEDEGYEKDESSPTAYVYSPNIIALWEEYW